MAGKLRVAVLLSGRGSNLEALIRACREQDSPAEIVLVVANNPDAGGLAIAQASGIATAVVDHRRFASREAFDAAIDAELRRRDIALVCLAGFMRLLTPGFVEGWRGRMINIHPSLLPAFKGRHPQRQALEAGATVSGCTVHYVTPEMDAGPIVAQEQLPVLPGDSEASLSARILEAEHRLYPRALMMVARKLRAEVPPA